MTITVWVCPYCPSTLNRVEVVDTYEDPLNHLLDEHRAELIAEKPVILRDAKGLR